MTDKQGSPEINLLTQCTHCQANYLSLKTKLVKQAEQYSIFHVHCSSCDGSMLLSMKRNQGGIMVAGIVTDCNAQEAKRFGQARPISIDDVIAAHSAVELDNFLKIG